MANPPPELSEKNFINESYKKNPFPFWFWLCLVASFSALIWGGTSWYYNRLGNILGASPFLQVTNREMSLFLWQNPEYMRVNAKQKSGYLPAFKYIDKVTLDIAQADEFAVAPPELLFRYHTWNRLISSEFSPRPIPKKEFENFLSYAEEWHPRYWPEAPKKYVNFIETLPQSAVEDLSMLSKDVLPISVRMAFQGWQNYFIDGEAINAKEITYEQMNEFLRSHPHYARNFWRNVVEDHAPNYLIGVSTGSDSQKKIPKDELTSFLRVAYYNYSAGQSSTPKNNNDKDNKDAKKPLKK